MPTNKQSFRKSFTYDGRRYEVYGNTEQEAIVKMAYKIRDLEEHKVVLDKSTLVSDWAWRACEAYKSNMHDNTLKKYKYKMQHYVLDYIGSMPVSYTHLTLPTMAVV